MLQILNWIKKEGEVRAIDRLRLLTLTHCFKEKVSFDAVDEQTGCSDELIAIVRQKAGEVVGKPCPV